MVVIEDVDGQRCQVEGRAAGIIAFIVEHYDQINHPEIEQITLEISIRGQSFLAKIEEKYKQKKL